MSRLYKFLPGLIICFFTAIFSFYLGEKIPLVGGAIFALMFGILLNLIFHFDDKYLKGISFTSKKVLKFSIVLLGFGLNIKQVLEVGKISLIVMIFTLSAAFGFGWLFGKLFDMNWKLSSLISAGTGVCGGSAIAALSPVIEAEDSDVTYAMSATFIFDIVMILLFPIMGKMLSMSDLSYGLWAGTAVNDTSSVVAAGYAFSDKAGEFATIVKLTRTLSIIPITIIFSYINQKKKSQESRSGSFNIKKIFPYFIIFFILAAIFNSIGFVSTDLSVNLVKVSKFLMIMALSAIGLKTNFRDIKKSGFKPMIHGFIVSIAVVIVSLGVQFFIGQI
ncbi:YeiH family protein [Oceanotoga sp. DSM 15011]|uniref:YeiH family protein n=1 Tax=Oceanotoga sp. DSM 15011 TaxID=2984951 RepID=UPI0021F4D1DD|nr:YeiH family protein [Oceanotoga sp. DSM 15011]UYP01160.1 YeiH family protein [Oceanotoga sp. DSM 15011]